MANLELIIGNKAYSSWSLRGWLSLKESGQPFEEVRLPLYTEQWEHHIGGLSPSGRVPVLRHGEIVVWDSMAICEYMRERFPGAVGWPEETQARASARSVSAEMHSGFQHIREEMPFNCRAKIDGLECSEGALDDVARVKAIWRDCRATFGARGPWLFGTFSIADIMFAPVALRFITYGVPLEGMEKAYVETVAAMPAVQEWCAAAREEREVIPQYELGRR